MCGFTNWLKVRSHRTFYFCRCRSYRSFVVAQSLSCSRSSIWHNSPCRSDDVIQATRSFLPYCSVWFSMVGIVPVAAVYLLWKSHKRRTTKRRRFWVHNILQMRTDLGEYHRLFQELRLDANRFQSYMRLTTAQFVELLARIGGRIARLDTNYRRSIPAEERLFGSFKSHPHKHKEHYSYNIVRNANIHQDVFFYE